MRPRRAPRFSEREHGRESPTLQFGSKPPHLSRHVHQLDGPLIERVGEHASLAGRQAPRFYRSPKLILLLAHVRGNRDASEVIALREDSVCDISKRFR
jgi:hypothetical protein